MTDITAFLNARLDDDEAYARQAAEEFGPDWIEIWSGTVDLTANLPDRQPPDGSHWDPHVVTNDAGVSRHMVRHDPARALADVAAKRRILAFHSTPYTVVDGFCVEDGGECTHAGESRCQMCGDADGCPTLRYLAGVYADHRNYDHAWTSC